MEKFDVFSSHTRLMISSCALHLRRSWIPHSWQPSHPALYCWPFTASPSPFLTCSPPGPTFPRLEPHSCPPLTWRCSVSPRLASPFCTHCSLQSCFSTLPLTLTPSPLAKNWWKLFSTHTTEKVWGKGRRPFREPLRWLEKSSRKPAHEHRFFWFLRCVTSQHVLYYCTHYSVSLTCTVHCTYCMYSTLYIYTCTCFPVSPFLMFARCWSFIFNTCSHFSHSSIHVCTFT